LRERYPRRGPGAPVTLSRGADGRPALVCLPSLVAPATPYQYARFAEPFHGRTAVTALAPTGYRAHEYLPETLDDAVELHAEAIRRATARPFVLVGYSSGGWLAHAVAHRLEQDGAGPRGIVLLDTHLPGDRAMTELQDRLYRELAGKPELVALLDDIALPAMGHYLDLFRDWQPQPIAAPTLLVAAAGSAADWPLPHDVVPVPGTHASLIEDLARDTALAVDSRLG
ncbi:thioesterase domain-containing protein, partial [Streptomyces sp. SID3343]|uniref:thioesterase domain-containing protein n=1 Tax=Streptomyces sp. SID3343 TaxID=2690260 RepID=UPI00136E69B8